MSKNVDQLALHSGGLGMAELHPCKPLEVLVQEPGMVDDRLEDERLEPRNGGAVPAMNRAGRQLRARDDVGLVGRQGANGEWRVASSGRGAASRLPSPIRYSPFAIRSSGAATRRPRL